MNFKVLLGLIACIAFASGKKDVLHFPAESIAELAEVSMTCMNNSGIDPEWVSKLLSAQIEDRPEIRKFVYCFATDSGYADKNGHFVVDRMRALIGNHKTKDRFMEATEECNKIQGKGGEDTMYHVVECFFKKTPVEFTM